MTTGQEPRLRRLCLVVDIEAYGGRPYSVQQRVQAKLDRALDHACERAGIRRPQCEQQDRGDGQLLLLPPGADEARVLPGLVLGLRDALHTMNRSPGTDGRIRIRAALAQGAVQRAPLGYVAWSVELASRLLDCAEIRAALAAAAASDMALVVAADLYADAFATGAGGLPGTAFTQVTVSIPAKRFEAVAWVGTAGRGTLDALPPAAASAAQRRRSARAVLTEVLGTIGAGLCLIAPGGGGGDAGDGTEDGADGTGAGGGAGEGAGGATRALEGWASGHLFGPPAPHHDVPHHDVHHHVAPHHDVPQPGVPHHEAQHRDAHHDVHHHGDDGTQHVAWHADGMTPDGVLHGAGQYDLFDHLLHPWGHDPSYDGLLHDIPPHDAPLHEDPPHDGQGHHPHPPHGGS
ncbi:hypothetical protein GCM10009665_67730 [Kitasatospora nipponensis]|uniref:Uncharacterized protein n=1 Tax=Kitasatospora nipponensis TaxID=258049 RepID=A0ABN1WZV1_9ACTN